VIEKCVVDICPAVISSLMVGTEVLSSVVTVFARMSQPSHPVRCSKKAIIRSDDYVATPGEEKNR
jgi:hypothetical protein